MDTKTLHDWAVEAGLNLRDEDGYQDAIQVWIDAAMASPESLYEYYADWMVDKEREMMMLKWIGRAYVDQQRLSERGTASMADYQRTIASGLTQHLAFCAGDMMTMVLEGLTKHVNDNADDWWAEVQSYAGDMEEGQREDFEYEQRKDRMLEER